MSVAIETTLGDIIVDLFLKERPRACLNFLKLCKIKYYNFNLFHTVSRGFIAQTGDPTGSRTGGESIYGVLEGPLKRYVEAETNPRIKHTKMGLISFVCNEDHMMGSQFFFTLGEDLTYLDAKHCVFGEVVEGHEVLELINEAICCTDERPYQDIRITHTVILDDPLPDPSNLRIPSRSPSPSAERLQNGRIPADEDIDETAGKSIQEVNEIIAEREAKARATILEMVGDIPDVDVAPPENVLFVCKLNPVTTDDDLEIIFSRFGKIKSCEVIRDHKTGDSLQYAFIEFEEQKSCEDAYFKMDNVLIDDRRIHVDFSQSVSKLRWNGKGRGVTHFDEKGRKIKEPSQKGYKGNRAVKNGRLDDSDSRRDKNNEERMQYKKVTGSRKRSASEERSTRKSRSRSRSNDERYSKKRRDLESNGNHRASSKNDGRSYLASSGNDKFKEPRRRDIRDTSLDKLQEDRRQHSRSKERCDVEESHRSKDKYQRYEEKGYGSRKTDRNETGYGPRRTERDSSRDSDRHSHNTERSLKSDSTKYRAGSRDASFSKHDEKSRSKRRDDDTLEKQREDKYQQDNTYKRMDRSYVGEDRSSEEKRMGNNRRKAHDEEHKPYRSQQDDDYGSKKQRQHPRKNRDPSDSQDRRISSKGKRHDKGRYDSGCSDSERKAKKLKKDDSYDKRYKQDKERHGGGNDGRKVKSRQRDKNSSEDSDSDEVQRKDIHKKKYSSKVSSVSKKEKKKDGRHKKYKDISSSCSDDSDSHSDSNRRVKSSRKKNCKKVKKRKHSSSSSD